MGPRRRKTNARTNEREGRTLHTTIIGTGDMARAIATRLLGAGRTRRGEELRGRIVVDVANPVDWDTMDGLVTAGGTSGAEERLDGGSQTAIRLDA